jgi:hypothetical protein
MATTITLLGGVGAGCLFILLTVIRGFRSRRSIELADVVVVFLAGAGVTTGIKVCAFAVDLLVRSIDVGPYVFLGGIAVIWVALTSMYRVWSS